MLQMFAIRDLKAVSFMPPYTAPNKGVAIRSFTDAVNDPSSMLSKYPDDFALFHIGSYDPETGVVTPVKTNELVVGGRDVLMAAA